MIKNIKCILFLIIIIMPIMVYAIENETIPAKVGNVEKDDSIIDVEITWSSLYFTYVVENNYSWDNSTHKYVKSEPKSYWNNSNSVIKVKNNSSKAVNVKMEYKNIINSVNGAFSNDLFKIEGGKTKSVTFSISGSLTPEYSKTTNAGTITIGF